MRLIDADKLNRKDVNCANVPMNFIDTAPTVEAIPKADYENRLKADMVATLTEIQLEIEEQNHKGSNCYRDGYTPYSEGLDDCKDIIQQKINSLKENNDV